MANNLVITWTGTDRSLNVQSPNGGKITLNETSNNAPAVAIFQGRLYVAWTGTDSHLNVICSLDGGKTFDYEGMKTLDETSFFGPSLCTDGTTLYLGWTGTDSHLNWLTSADGTNYGDKVTSDETSPYAMVEAAGTL